MFQIAAAGGFFVVLIGCLMILGPKSFASANGCIEDYTAVAGWPVFFVVPLFLTLLGQNNVVNCCSR